MSSIARGDGAAASSSALTRYYAESGTPPGRFTGAGLAGLNNGTGIAADTIVSEEALWRMLGMMADPVTGDALGRRPQHWPATLAQRIASRVAALPVIASEAERSAAIEQIESEERRREASIARPVAAFDLTFSVPKSVSTLWALADDSTQATIYRAHRDAIAVALVWAEQNVIFTRTGAGGAVQEDVRGAVAAAFDHWDSRAGDPHLHTHLVIANRVQTEDGRWRSIDSKTLFRYTVALSELHEGVVQDLLTERLGVYWEERVRRHSAVPRYEIAGVPGSLVEEFSTRTTDIAAATEDLVNAFADKHGRHPTSVEVLKLRQRATLDTRSDKHHSTLAQLMKTWHTRARKRPDGDPTEWADRTLHRAGLPALTNTGVGDEMLNDIAQLVLDEVAHKRATFGHANVLAEVHRQLHGVRFATSSNRLAVAERVTRFALDTALALDPPNPGLVPPELLREDGTSRLRHRGADRYTTIEILDAESRLLDAGRDLRAATVPSAALASVSARLGADQAAAIASIATSGRSLDLLVGPAGAGKTTSLAALKAAWESRHGPGSVIGLAPSATAAQVLADQLAIPTENTAKWLAEQTRKSERAGHILAVHKALADCSSTGTARARRLKRQLTQAWADYDKWAMRAPQLMIIDEASIAGTLTLDSIVTDARRVGAKVLLVGDWAQLGAIEAGGSFHMLANDRPDTPTLTQVHRFSHTWEADASKDLRDGSPDAIDAYQDHHRIHAGDRVAALHNLFDAWSADTDAGMDSVMIAVDDDAVASLNALAQAHMRGTRPRRSRDIDTADQRAIEPGDRIVTRRNDRRLSISGGTGWVKNGDLWTITDTHRDGSVTAAGIGRHGSVRLPADYVRDHVELGYATTVHRAQGRTVDTAHALITHRATREALYVAATRGRTANHLYVDTQLEPDPDTNHGPSEVTPAQQVLTSILDRTASAASAHAALPRTDEADDGGRPPVANRELVHPDVTRFTPPSASLMV